MKKKLLVKCPGCSTERLWSGNEFRPFCSERCQVDDQASWASEEYRVASKGQDDETASYPEDMLP